MNTASPADGGTNTGDSQGTGNGDSDPGTDGGVMLNPDSGVVQDDAPPGCPGPGAVTNVQAPVGRLLASGNSLSARGVTSDGYEIFSDDYAFQLYAVPIAGGPVQTIASLGSNFWVTVVGQVVFAWSNVSAADVGSLTIWSSAHGAHAIAPSSFGILGTSSPDGSQVLYLANVDSQGQTGDVYLANSDGSGATRLLQGQQLTGCFPQLGFAGSYVVASHCDVARGDGPSTTISSFQSPGWTRADLMTNAQNTWSADMAGTFVLVSTAAGVLTVPIGGGAGTTVDSAGFMGQLISGGSRAIYGTTNGGMLRSSPVKPPSPTTLAQNFGGFYAVSPSQAMVLYYENQTSNGTDVFLSSTTAAGRSQTLAPSTNGAVNGAAFTADSNYALYSTGNDVCTGAAAFNAFPVNGGSAIQLGSNVWNDWSATGSKVVFNDNFVATGGLRFGRADIESVDLSTGTTATPIVSQADAVIDLSPAGDQIIYSWTVQPGAQAGIYVTAVP
ncbi:MAG TPA: hypothetical protein VGL81_34330 [Polyangiaceae bacterium]|jgi:hypothetical protein